MLGIKIPCNNQINEHVLEKVILTSGSVQWSNLDPSFFSIEKAPATKPFAAANCSKDLNPEHMIRASCTYHIQCIAADSKCVSNIINISVHHSLSHEELGVSIIHIPVI